MVYDVAIHLRISRKQHEAIKNLSKRKGVGMSEATRLLIDKGVKAYGTKPKGK